MRFRTEPAGQHIQLRKGLSYKGEYLVSESELGLVGLDAFFTGGGYKPRAEKPYSGPYKQEHLVEPGDVLLAMTEQQDGLLASPLIVPDDLGGYEELVCSHHVAKVIATSGKIKPEFLYNFLRVPINRTRAAYGNTGTTVQDLPYEVIYEQLIPVPSIEEQDRINSFIATLDRRIELNTAMATTLEKLAQSLFRSWFVDFDPVKAKMAGEKPVGMDDATAALFPDSMGESELGPIPMGWEPTKVEALLHRIKVSPLPKSTETSRIGQTLVLEQGESVVAGFVEGDASVEASPSNPVFIFGDHTCRTYLSTLPFSVFPNTIVLTSKLRNPYWAFWAVRDIQKFESYRRHWMELAFQTVVLPPEEVAEKWGETVSKFHAQIDALMVQSRYLASLRDSLLPRLISGELQIPEEMLAK